MKNTSHHHEAIAKVTFASVYPHYVTKVNKNGRSKEGLNKLISTRVALLMLVSTLVGFATTPNALGSSVYLIDCEWGGSCASKVGNDKYLIEFQN